MRKIKEQGGQIIVVRKGVVVSFKSYVKPSMEPAKLVNHICVNGKGLELHMSNNGEDPKKAETIEKLLKRSEMSEYFHAPFIKLFNMKNVTTKKIRKIFDFQNTTTTKIVVRNH